MEHSQVRDCGRSLMKVRNNTGPSTVPCGMPDFGDCHDDLNPLTQTHCLWFVRKLLSQESEERENPSADNLPIRPGMPTRSYALLRSRKAACTCSPLSITICHFCTRKQSCVTVEWLGRNPDWCWKIRECDYRYLRIWLLRSFSISLATQDVNDIGR